MKIHGLAPILNGFEHGLCEGSSADIVNRDLVYWEWISVRVHLVVSLIAWMCICCCVAWSCCWLLSSRDLNEDSTALPSIATPRWLIIWCKFFLYCSKVNASQILSLEVFVEEHFGKRSTAWGRYSLHPLPCEVIEKSGDIWVRFDNVSDVPDSCQRRWWQLQWLVFCGVDRYWLPEVFLNNIEFICRSDKEIVVALGQRCTIVIALNWKCWFVVWITAWWRGVNWSSLQDFPSWPTDPLKREWLYCQWCSIAKLYILEEKWAWFSR